MGYRETILAVETSKLPNSSSSNRTFPISDFQEKSYYEKSLIGKELLVTFGIGLLWEMGFVIGYGLGYGLGLGHGCGHGHGHGYVAWTWTRTLACLNMDLVMSEYGH
jgi:hypothetical protein